MTEQEIQEFHAAHQSSNPDVQQRMAKKLQASVATEVKAGTSKNMDLASAALSVAATVLQDPDSISVLTVMQASISEAKARLVDKDVKDALVIGGTLLDGYQDKDLPTIKRTLGNMLTRLAGNPQTGEASKHLKLMINAAANSNTVPEALLKFNQGLIQTALPRNTVEGRFAGTLFAFLFQEARRQLK